MENERPDEVAQNDGVGAEETPIVILPSPNTQGVTGGLQGVASNTPLISPQPFVEPAQEDSDALATRIEAEIAEDGRFTAFQSDVAISVRDGAVRLAGVVPSESQRHSIVSAVRAVHGVKSVDDALIVS